MAPEYGAITASIRHSAGQAVAGLGRSEDGGAVVGDNDMSRVPGSVADSQIEGAVGHHCEAPRTPFAVDIGRALIDWICPGRTLHRPGIASGGGTLSTGAVATPVAIPMPARACGDRSE